MSFLFVDFDTSFLLVTVSSVNRQLNNLIKTSACLYRCITAGNDEVVWNINLFEDILQKIKFYRNLQLGHISSREPCFILDNIFITSFAKYQPIQLQFIDISGLPLSTLSFLLYTPNLVTLIISECKYLQWYDLKVLRKLKKLVHEQCGFLTFNPSPVLNIFRALIVTHLDISGLGYTEKEICYHPFS